jgi:hypothetical protein
MAKPPTVSKETDPALLAGQKVCHLKSSELFFHSPTADAATKETWTFSCLENAMKLSGGMVLLALTSIFMSS